MSEELSNYLSHYSPSFWKVEEDAVVWSVIDKTIILREEFYLFAQKFEVHGFPNVEALFLFLGSLTDEAELLIHYANTALRKHELIEKICGLDWQKNYIEKVHLWSERVKLINDVRHWKVTLCDMLLPTNQLQDPRTSRVLDAGALDRLWERGTTSRGEHPLGVEMQARSFAFAMMTFLEVPVTVTSRELDAFQRTGVLRLPEVEISEQEKSLLEMLEEGVEESRVVAALTKLLLPSFALSGRMFRPQDLPLGGYSDLSNKGTLDRLVISELAHDSLTMAVRVVNGEALFLRRDSPNVRQLPKRFILLDNGVRLWGLGRVMAAAVGLALVKAGEGEFPFSVLAPTEDAIEEYNFSQIDGVTDFMSTLTSQSDLTAQIDAFFDARYDTGAEAELFMVTSERTAKDAKLKLMLAERSREMRFQVITVSDRGQVHVFVWHRGAVREEKHLEVDLDEVVRSCQTQVPSENEHAGNIPVILKRREFPMRFVVQYVEKKMRWAGERGVLSVTRNGEMYMIQEDQRGATLVGRDVPPGDLVFAGIEPSKELCVAVMMDADAFFLYRVDSDHRASAYPLEKCEAFQEDRFIAASLTKDGYLLIAGKTHVCVYSLEGKWLAGGARGGISRVEGDFVCSKGGWEMVHVENGQLRYLPVDLSADSIGIDDHEKMKECQRLSYSGATLVKRFAKVHVTRHEQLILISRKNSTWQVCVLASGDLVMRQQNYKIQSPEMVAKFEQTKTHEGVEFEVAVLENGSEVWLDPRGYVHLVPVDRSVGELSLLTRPGQLCAWHSHEGYCGAPYFQNDTNCELSVMRETWDDVLQAMVSI